MYSIHSFTKNYAELYDVLYRDKNYKREFKTIYSYLIRKKKVFNNILELGCGTGTFSKLFLKLKKSRILAIDSSKHMIKIAKKKNNNNRIIYKHLNISDFKSKQRFNLVYALFHVLSYQKNMSQTKNFFKISKKYLSKDGILVCDFLNKKNLIYSKPRQKFKFSRKKNLHISRYAIPELIKSKNIIKIKYYFSIFDIKKKEARQFTESHTMQYFDLKFIKKIVKENNLKILKIGEPGLDLNRKKANLKSWVLTLVAQRV